MGPGVKRKRKRADAFICRSRWLSRARPVPCGRLFNHARSHIRSPSSRPSSLLSFAHCPASAAAQHSVDGPLNFPRRQSGVFEQLCSCSSRKHDICIQTCARNQVVHGVRSNSCFWAADISKWAFATLQGLRAGASVSERRCSKGLEEMDDADMLADSSESFINHRYSISASQSRGHLAR
ncbi:hypothetical protein C8Q72DRAFT_523494 [Fomitopsis betulina]|nr:hypothetical protein C8Q72DRAFT_523494 [Fomitopsis betulina]